MNSKTDPKKDCETDSNKDYFVGKSLNQSPEWISPETDPQKN